MAKVLLIQPHYDRRGNQEMPKANLPLTLIYVGTAIEDKHQVKIYDRNLDLDDSHFLKFLKGYNPDIIGFTIMTAEMLFDFIYLGKLVKKEMPEKIIIAGGVHPSIEPDSVLNEPYVDYILRGEGEEAFLEFCDTFDKNPKKLKTLKNINHNPLRPFIDMNKMKFPNYDLVDLKKYNIFYLSLSRGCPGTCAFCYNTKMWGLNGRPCIRAYSTEKSIELVKLLVEKYKIKLFSIIDDNFVPFKSRAIEICNLLAKYNVHFFCFGRADYVDDEILRALKKAGCHTVQIGIESGSQRILDVLNKKVTVMQNYEAIACCKRNKIFCDASFMIGLPTETLEDLKMTAKLIKESEPDVINLKIYVPLPGAPLFDYCVKKKLIEKPKTLEQWADWTGSMAAVRHNVSEIPDEELMKAAIDLWNIDYYKKKFKKLIYWLRIGEYKYVLRGLKRVFITGQGYLKIPFIDINRSNKKKIKSV